MPMRMSEAKGREGKATSLIYVRTGVWSCYAARKTIRGWLLRDSCFSSASSRSISCYRCSLLPLLLCAVMSGEGRETSNPGLLLCF